MLNFPIPYHDELVYSLIARAGVHTGITSPKQLLDEVFGNRKVMATVDLPSHLKRITEQYSNYNKITLKQLIYQHTLFPIYAPFVPEKRRRACLNWMSNKSKGASIHLSLGISASRIKKIKTLRYCPSCIKKQIEHNGEYYWMRSWQIAGADNCIEHGRLIESEIELNNYHRHYFEAASPKFFDHKVQSKKDDNSKRVTHHVMKLLVLGETKSPEYWQWSEYYKSLANKAYCNRGEQIAYSAVKSRINQFWSNKWLNIYGLKITDDQTCWLRAIFRKHRKSFSYLEHIVVLDAFLDHGWDIGNIIKSVAKLTIQNKKESVPIIKNSKTREIYQHHQNQWLKYVIKYGIKIARMSGGGASYAWLYRHDRYWLMKTNEIYKIKRKQINTRVDWNQRDKQIVKILVKIRAKYQKNINCPRRSRNWYLSKLSHSSNIENNIDKLVLTVNFLDKYVEDIPDYQIRRIIRAVKQLEKELYPVIRWRILRLAGLSEERLKDKARTYLEKFKEI